MATAPPTDPAALLFGAYRRDVLALLLLHPEESKHLREIARVTGKAPGTLLRELNALVAAGILQRRPQGNQVLFQADPACPIHEDLRNILKKTVGVAGVLREALAPLAPRIRAAFVYGSVARGDERPHSDLDVLVVGDVDFADLVAALAPAQEVLCREVNPNVYPALEFDRKRAQGSPFLERVLADRKIFILGGEDDLGKPAANRKAQGARRKRAGGRTPA